MRKSPLWLQDDGGSPKKVVAKHLDPLRAQGQRAKTHERRVAKEMGGRRLPASGALPFGRRDKNTAAADVRTDALLIQHKSTIKDSLTVKRDWLYELSVEAQRRSLDPALMMSFDREVRCSQEWIAVPKDVFYRLLSNQPERS